MKRGALCLWLTLLVLASPGRVWGQSLALSSATIAFPNAGVAQLNAGGVSHPGITVSVDAGSSTTSWTLSLRSDDAALGAGGKALSDLEWRIEGSDTWTAATTIDQTLATGTGNGEVLVYFRTRLRWASDGPSNYGAGLTFSLTTNG